MKKALFTRHELPAARARRAAHALLGHAGARATSPSTSASPAPARRRCRPTRPAASSATTSTAGATTASSTSRAAATPRSSASPPRAEPQIFQAIRFGSVLENVVVDPLTRAIHWDDDSITENTRATYPVEPHPRRDRDRAGRHAAQRLLPRLRRLRRPAADRQADARDGELPLPLRLHRQGRRHGGGRGRAGADLLGLLRRAVHAARPGRVRGRCWPSACATQPDAVLAGQHRLDRRAVRRRQAHAHLASRATCSRPRSRARWTTSRRRRTRCSACSCRRTAPGVPAGLLDARSHLGGRRRLRRAARRRWRSASPPTSSASPAACRPTSPRPARAQPAETASRTSPRSSQTGPRSAGMDRCPSQERSHASRCLDQRELSAASGGDAYPRPGSG